LTCAADSGAIEVVVVDSEGSDVLDELLEVPPQLNRAKLINTTKIVCFISIDS
jgi:hypothetical protein